MTLRVIAPISSVVMGPHFTFFGGLVGLFDYWCLLDPGYDFPTESMPDGTACNMHGGTLRIVEKVKDNGSRHYYVEAQRCWKTVMENVAELEAAKGRCEELDEPLGWSSPLIRVQRDEREGGDRYCYDYKVPTLSSDLAPLTVEIVGTTELRVKESMDNQVVVKTLCRSYCSSMPVSLVITETVLLRGLLVRLYPGLPRCNWFCDNGLMSPDCQVTSWTHASRHGDRNCSRRRCARPQ